MTEFLTNPGWANYFDRSFEQIRDKVITDLQSNVPEITDHTESNPWIKTVSIWAALVELLGFYIDNAAREAFLTQAREFQSAVKHARLFDYRVKGPIPASVTLRFTSNIPATGNINIPQYTEVQTGDGIIFLTAEAATINLGETFVDVIGLQQERFTNVNIGDTDGTADQVLIIDSNVVDNSTTVSINAIQYAPQDTFAFSISTDEHCVIGLNENQEMTVTFGDGTNGIIPPFIFPVLVDYFTTLGTGGNVGAGLIIQINDVIVVPGVEQISVNNANQAQGGTDAEDLVKLQKRIPISVRTRYRAVTMTDFILLGQLQQGVEKIGVIFDCAVGNTVNIFVVPEGGGLASQVLIDNLTDFYNERKIIGREIQVQSAGALTIQITANITALPNFTNANVEADIISALETFFDVSNQEISGSVQIGNLYEVIEGVQGVSFSEITLLLAIPNARPLNNENVLDWDREILSTSTVTTRWLIRFTLVNQYELFRGTDFVGTFLVGVQVSEPEIQFTINSNTDAGDDFEFFTYPYNQSINVTEPSIPVTDSSNLFLTVSGGV